MEFENTSDFVRWNEEMTKKYDSEDYHLRSNFIIRWIERRRVQSIVDLIAAGEHDTVIELGCGAGIVLEKFLAQRLIGIDLSAYILQKTKRRLQKRNAYLLQANAEMVPFSSNSFVKLVCTEVIEHVLEPRNVIKELVRLATDEASIVITIPNEALIDRMKSIIGSLRLNRLLLMGTSSSSLDVAAYDSPSEANEWHLHRFDLDVLRQVTEGLLLIIKVKAIPFRFLPLRYVVLCKKQKAD